MAELVKKVFHLAGCVNSFIEVSGEVRFGTQTGDPFKDAAVPADGAPLVADDVRGDAEKPGAEQAVSELDSVPFPPGFEKDGRGQVFGGGSISYPPKAVAIDGLLVAVEERREGVRVVLLTTAPEFLVVEILHHSLYVLPVKVRSHPRRYVAISAVTEAEAAVSAPLPLDPQWRNAGLGQLSGCRTTRLGCRP